jgi:hypothetical protein
MYVSKNKQLISFKHYFGVLFWFIRETVKIPSLISNVFTGQHNTVSRATGKLQFERAWIVLSRVQMVVGRRFIAVYKYNVSVSSNCSICAHYVR